MFIIFKPFNFNDLDIFILRMFKNLYVLSSVLLYFATHSEVIHGLDWPTQTLATVCECAPIRRLVEEIPITNYNSETISISRNCENHFIATVNSNLDGVRIEVRGDNDLDYETQPSYQCELSAKTTTTTDTADVTIFLEDCNDNSPVFTNNILITSVDEDESVGALVFTVDATDADSGTNGELVFSIVDTSGKFTIGAVTGRVTLAASLDFEAQREHDFIVTVRDSGNPGSTCEGTSLNTSNTLTVLVVDSPDTPPVFSDGCCQFSVQECAPVNSQVGTVMAFDGDLEIADTLNFTIIISIPQTNCLLLSSNGVLAVAAAICLDRESITSYVVKIIARESHFPFQATIHDIPILITDCNDQVPAFVSLPSTFSFMEGLAAHSTLLVLTTSDGDEPNTNNSRTFISILPGGNNDSIFAVNNDSSALTITQTLDREMYPSGFRITLEVTDYGSPPLSSTQLLNIELTDINDNPPTFVQDNFTGSVTENTNAGESVIQLFATDLDIGTNGFVSYRILSGSDGDYLRLDATTGVMYTTNVNIDREIVHELEFVVSASDSGVNPLQTTASVSIQVLDENDNSPVFSPLRYNFSVEEEQPPSLISLPIAVTDLDDGATGNGRVEVSIIVGYDDAGLFYLSGNQIRTNLTFDRESRSQYDFILEARDNGDPQQISTATVIVSVSDINDNSPQFTRDAYVVGFPETADHGTQVVQFFVTDIDLPPHNSIVFELDKLVQGFEFNTMTGILVTERLFNGRAGESFDFEIFAFDDNKVGEYLNASKPVKVIVLKETERLIALIDSPIEVVRSSQLTYLQNFENITEGYVNIENLVPTSQNQFDNTRTEIIFHVIDLDTQQVVDPELVLKNVDERFDDVRDIFTTSSILSISQVHVTAPSPYTLPILISVVSLLGLCLCTTCCCFWVLFFYIKYYRKEVRMQADRELDDAGTLMAQQHAKSFSSLSAVGTSGIFSRSDAAVVDNPLWIYPYGDLDSVPSTESTLYETKELILDLFSEDLEDSLYTVPSRINTASLLRSPFSATASDSSSEDPDDLDFFQSDAPNFDFPSTSSKRELDSPEQSESQRSVI